jgi:asparagine synthase (glutamine-hydrolysing)
MCGFIALFSSSHSWDEEVLYKGSLSMAKRGPDDSGQWWSDNRQVGLSHRRLSVIDLNHRANQPMTSENQRYVIVFNGEIYNYKNLRDELISNGVNLSTQSDTEVILELFSLFGENCLQKLRGMFAFAIWDKVNKTFFIARDPYGIKPLYIAKSDNGFIVASQVKAILSTGVVSRENCPNGQGGFWLLGSVPEPYTWFKEIMSLPAGNFMWISKDGSSKKSWSSIAEGWSGLERPTKNIEENVRNALYESLELHMEADVPIGVFLSGGIDSTSLLAMLSDLGIFNTVGITLKYSEFEGSSDDESSIAAYAAKKYGAKHHVRLISKSEFENDLPDILSSMDQPSIDGINTWYASKCASELGLKVVLSGVGGDELFYGYKSFTTLPRLVKYWRIVAKIPGMELLVSFFMRKKAARSKNPRWNLFSELAKSIPGLWFLTRGVFAPEELSELMGKKLADEFLSDFDPVSMIVGMSGELPKDSKLALGQIESTCYLRNQLLRDSDWASMWHGVELRTPLVDAWLLKNLKFYLPNFYHHTNKSLLSNSPKNPLGPLITQRKKTGFSIPVNQWLREINPELNESGVSRGWAREVAKKIYQNVN